MNFTLEALYALHMLNNQSDDIPFVPLPKTKNEDRLETLRRVLQQGYQDLNKMGLIKDEKVTEECAVIGYLLLRYCESKRHALYGQYACAVQVDANDLFVNVIKIHPQANQYQLEQHNKLLFLATLYKEFPFFDNLKERSLDRAYRDWQPLTTISFRVYLGGNNGFRIKYLENRVVTYDCVIFEDSDKKIFEYDVARERFRSISGKNLKKLILRWMKITLRV